MARFRYQHGDRPLDGFTIEHGLGVGGFGEVYFAVSDSGRQVALKAVQNYEEIELRGIRHCMNLKSPHLVTVFDVRHNDRKDPFVVMEYVEGPSLRHLLNESPDGLGTTKAAFFLREIAKGLTYLHEAGVVHRDLKPHNVFYEEGYVKIGDYSLCKLISTTHHTGHTMTVGTVHYMAPEVSKGRYDSSVDIYALGIMLYEMLTGLPPFTGDSIGEILMKHMTEEPELGDIEEPFRSVIAKSLAKQPEDRYQTAEEMVEAVFGAEHVQSSVVAFNPHELTIVAEKAAAQVVGSSSRPRFEESRPYENQAARSVEDAELVQAISRTQEKVRRNVEAASSLAGWQPIPDEQLSKDPMPTPVRWLLTAGVVLALPISIGATGSSEPFFGHGEQAMIWMWSMIGSALLGFTVLRRKFLRHLSPKAAVVPRLAIDVVLVLAVLPLGIGVVPLLLDLPGGEPVAMSLFLAVLPFGVFDWHKCMHPLRASRLHLGYVVGSVVTSLILATFAFRLDLEVNMLITPVITAAIAMALQISSPIRRKLASPGVTRPTVAETSSGHGSVAPPTLPQPEAVVMPAAFKRSGSMPIPADASPYARWPLVALAGVFFLLPFLGGLHRFYVGKKSSGFIWLFTLGLAGVGQIVDIVRILRGEFCDAEGRTVLAWETSQAPATTVNPLSSVPAQGHAVIGLKRVTTILGNVMFTGAAALAAIAATLRFNSSNFAFVLATVGMGLLIGSTGFVFHARLREGPWSVARIVAATMVVGFGLAVACVSDFVGAFILAIFSLPWAMLLFAWPSRERRDSQDRTEKKEEVLV